MASEQYVSRVQLNKVCAFVDVQGFGLSKHPDSPFHFKPRELTFFGEHGSITHQFNTPIELSKLSKEQQKTLRFQSFYIHGLPFQTAAEEDFQAEGNFRRELVRLYDLFKSKERDFVAVKNDYLASYLREIGIKYIDLGNTRMDVPRLAELDEKFQCYDVCSLHLKSKNGIKYQCSFRKAKNFWSWILENRDLRRVF